MIHHHVDFGQYVIPVPGKTHVGSGGIWHTKWGYMLLSIEDIKSGLDKEFLPLEPIITGFRFFEKK